MAPLDSPLTTYSDTTPHKRVIVDAISIIDPADSAAVDNMGGLDGASSKFRFVNTPGEKVEWLEDTLFALADALNGSIATNTTALTVDDASIFQEGDIIYIDAEQAWVSAVNTSSEVLTVTRNYSGTQATHADGATVTIVGQARLEGDDSDDRAFTDRTAPFNYTQIYHQEIKVTGTHEKRAQYGIAGEFNYQAMKAVPSLSRLLERQLFYGARKAGSATTPRAMGGFGTFVTDNSVTASSGTVTQAMFKSALKASFDDGGVGPWTAFASSANMEDVAAIYDNSGFLRVDREETTIGMVIDRVMTPFGVVNFVLDRWATNTEIYLIDTAHAGMLTYRPWTQEPLAKDGDYVKGQVVGEFTLCVRQDKAHAVINNITT